MFTQFDTKNFETKSKGVTAMTRFANLFLGLVVISQSSLAHTIKTDYCSGKLFTEQVRDVECRNNQLIFKSTGLPNKSHILMEGIVATNQQFPTTHQYEFKIKTNPKKSASKFKTDAGAIGVAVNGVPIFDPSTQGKVDKKTGKRPHTLLMGELDKCGGHAGRGDDYHYHIAPVCLIEELGQQAIEIEKAPIGFAADGFPIHALGWFEDQNIIEQKLDECRGFTDSNGKYFYNVMREGNRDILDCFTGKPEKFAKDRWRPRKDRTGAKIVGYPVKFKIDKYTQENLGGEKCHFMRGTLEKEQLLLTNGKTKKIRNEKGSIFYCTPNCYGMFFEADKRPNFKGRVMYYDLAKTDCPSEIEKKKLRFFPAYEGPPQKRKPPQSTKKK